MKGKAVAASRSAPSLGTESRPRRGTDRPSLPGGGKRFSKLRSSYQVGSRPLSAPPPSRMRAPPPVPERRGVQSAASGAGRERQDSHYPEPPSPLQRLRQTPPEYRYRRGERLTRTGPRPTPQTGRGGWFIRRCRGSAGLYLRFECGGAETRHASSINHRYYTTTCRAMRSLSPRHLRGRIVAAICRTFGA